MRCNRIFLVLLAGLQCWGPRTWSAEQLPRGLPDKAKSLVERIMREPSAYHIGSEAMRILRQEEGALDALASALPDLAPQQSETLLSILADMGTRPIGPAQRAIPHHALVTDQKVIDCLVEALSDPAAEVRTKAARLLVARVERKHIVSGSKAIVSALSRWEGDLNYRLLGLAGSAEARDLLDQRRQQQGLSVEGIRLASAMLGDPKAQRLLLDEYLGEKDPVKKERLAVDLSYVVSAAAIKALAKDVRSPLVVRWGGKGRRSFRLVVVECLSRVYPHEKALWKPRVPPKSDEYYDVIEKWAEATVGVQWTRPRPAFMYESYTPLGGREVWPE